MSHLSIYESNWIELVFENRNKEYGAYKLRQESVRTSLIALFMGLSLISIIVSVNSIATHLIPDKNSIEATPKIIDEIIHLTDIVLPPKNDKTSLPQVKTTINEAEIVQKQLKNPVITHPNEASDVIVSNAQIPNTSNVSPSDSGIIGANPTVFSGSGIDTTIPDNTNAIVNAVALDKLPEFPGGIDTFYKYVGNHFEKPEIEGLGSIRVSVSFVIEKDGSMTDIQVKRDPGYNLGKEAIRVLKSLKIKWTPGMINSKPVRTSYNLPITVQFSAD